MSVGQLPHRGLSRAHTTDVRIIISILSGLTTWTVLFLAKSDIWQLWSVAFSHVSVFAGIPSLLTVSLHGNASVSSVAFIPKSGSYLMLAGAIALVTAGLAYALRKIALPVSIALFCISIVFGVTQLFSTRAHLHNLHLGSYLGALFDFSLKVIPLILGMLCVTGFIMPGRPSKQMLWFLLGGAYLIALPPVLITANALVLSVAGAGLLPFTALVSWFVIGVSAIAIFSQIASQ